MMFNEGPKKKKMKKEKDIKKIKAPYQKETLKDSFLSFLSFPAWKKREREDPSPPLWNFRTARSNQDDSA
jgi:hypothetical protein